MRAARDRAEPRWSQKRQGLWSTRCAKPVTTLTTASNMLLVAAPFEHGELNHAPFTMTVAALAA
jgi:hypothetical protein